jgi:hypothetical protein
LEVVLNGKFNLVGCVNRDNGLNGDNGTNDGIDGNVTVDVGAISGQRYRIGS